MRAIAILLTASLAGCAGANSQVATCQAEKEQLLATIRTQRDSNRALSEQLASLESRLDQAEKALAQSHSPPRFSKAAGEPLQVNRAASLSWRSPEEAAATPQTGDSSSVRSKLQKLASQDGRVKYDARAGAARVELPLAFRDETAMLTGEDKLRLDEVARLLNNDDTRDLAIVVSGTHQTRAKAVADYLDRHGIARERLLVSSGANGPSGGHVRLDLQASDAAVANRPPSESQRR